MITYPLFERFESLHYLITEKDRTKPCVGSMALHTGEASDAIRHNRRAAVADTPFASMTIVLADQTHSDNVVCIEEAHTRGWRTLDDAVPHCDALISPLSHVALGILTADCVPILLFDPTQRIIAAVHAGWRGSQKRIVAKTVATMQRRYGSKPSDIVAAIGPSIRGCCYEVDHNVAKHFETIPNALQAKQNGKWMLDLSAVNRHQLLDAGLNPAHIDIAPVCTACDTEHFFSYRAEACSGRFLSLIARTSPS